MSLGIDSILNIAGSALSANQTALNVTGNNIANVNTAGYSRQEAVFTDGLYVDANGGQVGTGASISQISREFNTYIESQYNDASTLSNRYNVLYQNLQYVETIFAQNDSGDMGTSLDQFFSDWSSLQANPSDTAARQALLNDTQSLDSTIQEAQSNIASAQNSVNQQVSTDVESANQIIQNIATLNGEIASQTSSTSTPNGLLDARATQVRDLAKLLNINTIDRGGGNLLIQTSNGCSLVDGTATSQLKYLNNQVTPSLTPGSSFNGKIFFEGQDSNEYTLRVVQAGGYSNGGAVFEASLDGGKTWMTSNSGKTEYFSAGNYGGKATVGNLSVYFGQASNSTMAPSGNLAVGDQFQIVPKGGVYYYQSASTPINLTPQQLAGGVDNPNRLTGGEIAGLLDYRDIYCGAYQEKLNTLAKSLIWEVNSQHSQGAGLEKFSQSTGTYAVNSNGGSLGLNSTGLAFAGKLSSGASMMYFYSASTGALASGGSFGMINFGGSGNALRGLDPKTDSLTDVANAINNTFGTFCTASILNNKLQITANAGYTFAYGSDSSGLYAALGLNTYFDGSSSSTISLNAAVGANSDFINAGHVDGTGLSASGDNTTATAIAGLATKTVDLSNPFTGSTSQTLGGYYSTMVSQIGSDAANTKYDYQFQSTMASSLDSQQNAVSGVNLDEELTNLMKYQHSYQAAAKLVTTADQMMQTVLGLKS
ncbi:MAG: flagellar hook-associated protein FlgK [Desulfovibrionaceae bacterium]|nr:flagellar hook-associated protein FlgK [Desulfovibrionaceae bacterium]MBF0512959.1 flagellar hook-associated protein FlgK [Desulfovibrionaceae bacterium]